jgi:hypothetical protein
MMSLIPILCCAVRTLPNNYRTGTSDIPVQYSSIRNQLYLGTFWVVQLVPLLRTVLGGACEF